MAKNMQSGQIGQISNRPNSEMPKSPKWPNDQTVKKTIECPKGHMTLYDQIARMGKMTKFLKC